MDQLNLEELESWTGEQQQSAKDLLVDSADVFAKSDLDLGKCNIIKHAIKITDPQPLRNIIEGSHLTYMRWLRWGQLGGASALGPMVWCWLEKKMGGLRFCIDLRKLNNRTIKDGYSLPRIEDTLDCLHGAVWFSTLDLKSGYWQVELEEEAKPLTALHNGTFRLLGM